MKKITTIVYKAVDYATVAFLTAFAAVFALLSLAALVCTIIEGDAFNLVGCAVAAALSWVVWSVREEMR